MDVETLERKYLENTQRSAELAKTASQFMPGGDTHGHFFNPPYHITIDHGEGACLIDVDGNRYLDCVNAYFVLIHGHCFPPIVEALQKQVQLGTGFGMPTETQVQFAELLCDRIPSLDEVRFVSSGSEATAMAIRAARAFTGKKKIMKADGGYHGIHNIGEINSFGGSLDIGDIKLTPERGTDGSELNDVVLFPYNEPDKVREIVKRQADEIAGLIVEPMILPSGAIPPVPGFLEALRDITREAGIVLIFDEVVTLPFEYGGLQDFYDVTPDLTTMGKGIGGGLPIGAWGGKREIMELWNPSKGEEAVIMVASSGGNPMSMTAGLTAMRHLTPETIKKRNSLGQNLRQGMNDVFKKLGVRAHVGGEANAFWVHWTDEPIRNPSSVVKAMMNGGEDIRNLLFLGMRRHGVYLFPSPSLFGNLSTVMTQEDVETIIQAFERTMTEIKPVIAKQSPQLLG